MTTPVVDNGVVTATVTVEYAARVLGIGRSAAYEAVQRGEIPALRIGKRIVVPRRALERLLDSAMPGQPSGASDDEA